MSLQIEVFNCQGKIHDPRAIARMAKRVWSQESKRAAKLAIIFVDEAYITQLNQRFLNRNTVTDVIAFPLSEQREAIFEGEIYVCTAQVERQARQLQVGFNDELLRMVIHGMLHFVGYGDHSEKEKQAMTAREDHYLEMLQMRDSEVILSN
ncbi:MAG: rRNA maturation RNase YbeY [bacterium]